MAAAALVVVVAYAWLSRSPSSPARAANASNPAPSATHSLLPTPATSASSAGRLAISATIDASGSLLVDERLEWAPTRANGPVRFGVPASITGAGLPDRTTVSPVVSDLQVSYDGSAISPDSLGGQRWSLTPPATKGRPTLDVRYRIDGVAVRSTPAPAGRATVVIAPMLRELAGRAPITFSVTGPSPSAILGLDCPLATAAKRVCGEHIGTRWSVTFTAQDSAGARFVTAQVNLPT
jgi:hypothetical protein